VPVNPKGDLLMFCQHRKWSQPTYEVVKSGPDHAPTFMCTVTVTSASRSFTAQGSGPNRRAAESDAANMLLSDIKSSNKLLASVGRTPVRDESLTATMQIEES
jgi:dsRNA-specific ribonuclease